VAHGPAERGSERSAQTEVRQNGRHYNSWAVKRKPIRLRNAFGLPNGPRRPGWRLWWWWD